MRKVLYYDPHFADSVSAWLAPESRTWGKSLHAGNLRSDAKQQKWWMDGRRKFNTMRYYPISLSCGAHPCALFWSATFIFHWFGTAPWGTNSLICPGSTYVCWAGPYMHTGTESSPHFTEVLSTVRLGEAWTELFTTAIAGLGKSPRGCEATSVQEESHKDEVTKTYRDCLAQGDTNWKHKSSFPFSIDLWLFVSLMYPSAHNNAFNVVGAQ